MKKAVKGTYQYLKVKKNHVILMTILYFAISLAVYIIGYISTHTRQNLLTIVAILGCLPACRSLVSMIMYWKAEGCSPEVNKKLEGCEGRLVGMYDLYFTSYQKNFSVSHMVVEGKNICGYTEDEKCDCNACETHLAAELKKNGFKDMTVKVFKDLSKYTDRLKQLNLLEHEGTPEKDDEVRILLYQITL